MKLSLFDLLELGEQLEASAPEPQKRCAPTAADPIPNPNPMPVAMNVTPPPPIKKPKRKQKAKLVDGLTERQYQVLRIVNAHGWCTAELVRRIFDLHLVEWTDSARWSHQLLRALEDLGFLVPRKVGRGTKTVMYAVTDRGRRYIDHEGDRLLCDTNAIKDPASALHFLRLAEIMIKIREFHYAKFWLTDFEVRSDNCFLGHDGLAKDYDSVAELSVLDEDRRVRIGIEYEHSQQSAARHAKLVSMLATEKRLHLVLFVLRAPGLRKGLMDNLKSLGAFVFFVDFDRLQKEGTMAPTYFWKGGAISTLTLNDVLERAWRREAKGYTPVHQLDLRVRKVRFRPQTEE